MSVKYLQMVGEVDPGGALPRPRDDGTLWTQCDGRKGPITQRSARLSGQFAMIPERWADPSRRPSAPSGAASRSLVRASSALSSVPLSYTRSTAASRTTSSGAESSPHRLRCNLCNVVFAPHLMPLSQLVKVVSTSPKRLRGHGKRRHKATHRAATSSGERPVVHTSAAWTDPRGRFCFFDGVVLEGRRESGVIRVPGKIYHGAVHEVQNMEAVGGNPFYTRHRSPGCPGRGTRVARSRKV
jgi:hypothetical protein